GERGLVLTAEAPFSTFEIEELPTTNWLESVAASPSVVVAVGDNATLFRRSGGTNWARVTLPTAQWLRGVCWRSAGAGTGLFVAVGEGGLIATSPDGLSWTARASGVATPLNRVTATYAGFVAVGDAGVALTGSADGRTWRRVLLNATGNLFAAAEELRPELPQPVGATLAVGDGEVRSWTTLLGSVIAIDETAANRPAPAPKTTLYNALYNGSGFVAGGAAGQILRGSRPSQFVNYLVWSANDSSARGFLFDAGTNAAVSTNQTARWENGAVTRVSTVVTNIAYVAVGDGPTILYSDDGAFWSPGLVPSAAQGRVLLGLAPRLDRWVAVGNSGTIIHSPVGFSPLVTTNRFTNGAVVTTVLVTNQVNTLGLAWYSAPSPTTADLRGVAAGPGLFVAAGSQGVILTSPTGTNWTASPSTTTSLLSGVAAWPGGFVAVGDRGTVLTSPDGTNWRSVASGTTNGLRRVRWLGDRLVAAGANGTLLASTNGSAWERLAVAETAYLYDVLREGDTFLAVG
ncbi:MAG: WD40/YVTN/BNR-like repeat-containing protein, partial [Verrucomicrobiota bacterium]